MTDNAQPDPSQPGQEPPAQEAQAQEARAEQPQSPGSPQDAWQHQESAAQAGDGAPAPSWKDRFDEFTQEAEKMVTGAVASVGGYVHERNAEIDGLLDKAAAGIDEKTKGKYADKVGKVKSQLSAGVAKLAEKRPSDPSDPASPTD